MLCRLLLEMAGELLLQWKRDFHEIALFPSGGGEPGTPWVCHQLYHFTAIYTRFPLPFHCLFTQSGNVLLKLVTICSSYYFE